MISRVFPQVFPVLFGIKWLLWVLGLILVSSCMVTKPELKPTPGIINPDNNDRVREDIYRAQFELVGSASPNNPVELVISIEPIIDLPDTTIEVLLPDGINFVNENRKWHVDASANRRIDFRTEIVISSVGEWEIRVVLNNPLGTALERVYFIVINASETGGTIITPLPRTSHPTNQPNNPIKP